VRTLKLGVAYLGTGYHGWQIQPGRPTIQGSLEEALARVLDEPVRVVGAGRTDAGVHARGQVASLVTGSGTPARGILLGTNNLLPETIRVMSVEEAPEGFHARHQAIRKEYAYRFTTAPVLTPFLAATVEQVRGELDLDRMAEAARALLGEHDFSAFCGPDGRAKNTVRTLEESRFEEEPDGVRVYRVASRSFLQYLVRTLAGTLFEVGRGRIPADAIPGILASGDRTRAGPTAAARGLTLERVHYPQGM
jgi:tRNA pseudouridine38-40 synthase